MRRFVFTARVQEPPDVVYSRLADFGRYPELAPSVLGVELDGATEADGAASARSTWEVTFRNGVMRWQEIDHFHRDRLAIEFEQEDGDLAVLRGSWLVAAEGDDATITFELEFDLGLPGLETFLEPVAERALRDNMTEIVHRLFETAELTEPATTQT
jgi:ribosome-associated toxin RatA of RatAB toxin-antitoxin module